MIYVLNMWNTYVLTLTHHNINFLYAIRGSIKNGYYLQTRNTIVMLISCLPDSNRNSVGEYVRVSNNWLNGEMTCPTSLRQIGRYFLLPIPNIHQLCSPSPFSLILFIIIIIIIIIIIYIFLFCYLLLIHFTTFSVSHLHLLLSRPQFLRSSSRT